MLVLEQISLQSFTILMGIIIASVGILVGTMTKTYDIILNVDSKRYQDGNIKQRNKFLTSSMNTFSRIEDSTLLLIKLYVANLVTIFLLKVDFNLIYSPVFSMYYPLFAKNAILTSIDIFIILIGIWIIYDIVSSIFTIQRIHIKALEVYVKSNQNNKE